MPRILIAPDKFKGSLTATAVADALRKGMSHSRPELDIRLLPVADGGDGTLDAALAAGFTRVPVSATGPTGEPVDTAYARRGDTAVVEMAAVSGLGQLPGGKLAALDASSRGTGEVIAAAVADGCRRIVLGIGGSACTDGGVGLVQALGVRVTDASGAELGLGGGALAAVAGLELTGLADLSDVEVVVACDVDNPLTGERGAAAVYAPQKGASPRDVERLDAALTVWADLVAATVNEDLRASPGAGAAGGVGFAALALLGAELRPGIELLLDLLDFRTALTDVDWVVVGEGSLDEQTLSGKAPVGVAAAARAADARVLAVCGRLAVSEDRLNDVGIEAVYSLSDLEPDPAVSMTNAAELLEELGMRITEEGVFDESRKD